MIHRYNTAVTTKMKDQARDVFATVPHHSHRKFKEFTGQLKDLGVILSRVGHLALVDRCTMSLSRSQGPRSYLLKFKEEISRQNRQIPYCKIPSKELHICQQSNGCHFIDILFYYGKLYPISTYILFILKFKFLLRRPLLKIMFPKIYIIQ